MECEWLYLRRAIIINGRKVVKILLTELRTLNVDARQRKGLFIILNCPLSILLTLTSQTKRFISLIASLTPSPNSRIS